MKPALHDLHLLPVAATGHVIHQPVLASDAAVPPTGEATSERLGVAQPLERLAVDFEYEGQKGGRSSGR